MRLELDGEWKSRESSEQVYYHDTKTRILIAKTQFRSVEWEIPRNFQLPRAYLLSTHWNTFSNWSKRQHKLQIYLKLVDNIFFKQKLFPVLVNLCW